MTEPKRYFLDPYHCVFKNGTPCYADMEEHEDADYVLYTAYQEQVKLVERWTNAFNRHAAMSEEMGRQLIEKRTSLQESERKREAAENLKEYAKHNGPCEAGIRFTSCGINCTGLGCACGFGKLFTCTCGLDQLLASLKGE